MIVVVPFFLFFAVLHCRLSLDISQTRSKFRLGSLFFIPIFRDNEARNVCFGVKSVVFILSSVRTTCRIGCVFWFLFFFERIDWFYCQYQEICVKVDASVIFIWYYKSLVFDDFFMIRIFSPWSSIFLWLELDFFR